MGMVSRNRGAGLNGGRKAERDVPWLEVGQVPLNLCHSDLQPVPATRSVPSP